MRVAVPVELRARYLGMIEPDVCVFPAVCDSMAALYPDVYSCEPSGRL